MIEVENAELDGVKTIHIRRFQDTRGWFSETFSERWLTQAGITTRFVQDNLSCSDNAGTIRGLHAQRAPMAQAKLVSVLAGAIFDTVIDCRRGSLTFGKHSAVELSEDVPKLLYVPAGFCHGFLTLKPATKVLYKVDNFYSQAHEVGIRWDDPALGIEWPLASRKPSISTKDAALPLMADFIPL